MAAIDRAMESLSAKGIEVVSVGFVSDPKRTANCFRQGMEGVSRSTRPDLEGHAGEWETSLAMRSFPELVDCDAAQSCEPNLEYNVEAFRAETERYEVLSKGSGYFGSPSVATAETGERLLTIRSSNMAQIILKTFRCRPTSETENLS
jgi:creatinine amidohydrolase/Fe(II)-dependent formamide hydrolase-like protein